ncbi:PAS/PAC sensor signal transduction histidine kinase [Paludibacter propionicigenes WB4]|uniref:histidine kinase n=1 Tax=Paludibacter propionicigenes (strain DSM 17365 / JCM 13257 / WB4) TaxID=694427 RepID=E4T6F8_PALPW|nr:PAS domain S-box protein [Paludibacter propionicigenes]ADQ80302.1 PAS/PAC sensor signal transduction histidine kinase [Paludibacter propionicigenes WB4]
MKKQMHANSITIAEANHDLLVNGILNSITNAFFSVDFEYRYTGYNELHVRRMKELYNVDVKLGDKLSDYQTLQIDWLKAKSFIDKALAGETFTEYVYLGYSGSKQLYSEVSHSPILNRKNEVIGVSIFSKDVTERKAIEDALKASELKYRGLVDNSPNAIAIYCDEKVVFVNNACFKLIGATTRNELIDKQVLDFIHPEFKELAASRMKEASINHKVLPLINERLIKLDGSYVDVGVKSIPIEFDGKHAVQLIIHDLTELRQAEEKIRETEILFSQAFNASPAAMSIANQKNGSYIAVNESFLLIAELHREDVIGKTPEELNLIDKDTRQKLKAQLIENGILTDVEVQAKSASGKPLVLMFSVQITELAGERCILSTMQDITERKKIEQALRESEEKFKKAFMTSPDCLNINRLDNGTYVLANEGFTKILGYTENEIIGRTSLEMNIWLNPAERDNWIKILFEDRKVDNFVTQFRTKTGELIYALVSAAIIELDGIPHVLSLTRDITKQKLVENSLRSSEEKYRSLFENNTSVMLLINPETAEIVDANPTACEFYGWTYDEICTKKITDINILPSDEIFNVMKDAKLKGRKHFHFVHRKANGELRDIEAFSTPIKDGDKNFLFTIIHDITSRVRAQKALNESEEKFKKAFTTSPDSVSINRLEDGVYVSVNDGFTRIMGYDRDEILGQSSIDKNVWVDANDRKKMVNEVKEKGFIENLVAQFRTKSGKLVYGMMSASIIELDGVKHVLNITRDIDKLKQAEKALQESEEKLSTLFSSMTEMVAMHELVFDEDGNVINYQITDCNNAYCQIFGIKKEDVIGKLATEFYHCESAPYLELYSKVGITGESYEFNTFYAPAGRHFLISAVSTKKNCFSTIASDITDIQRIQELITDKNKELENYLYVASHDLRSPLINIQGFSQRLQKQSEDIKAILADSKSESEKKAEIDKITNEGMPKTVDFILSNVSKMDTLIKSLLQISRSGRLMLNVNKIDMNQLINKIIAAHNYQITELSAQVIIQNLDYCYGDENQLNQLFSNIIDNALKYHDPNRLLKIEISSEVQYKKVRYAISDTGIGISSHSFEKIWDVFYRVDAKSSQVGEGIGLSIAKRIASKHNGKIWVESVEGKGSTFFIELQKQDFLEL